MPEGAVGAERPETYSTVSETFESVEQPIGRWEKIWNNATVRKVVLLIILTATWEVFARALGKPLMFPTFVETVRALVRSIGAGTLPKAALHTL